MAPASFLSFFFILPSELGVSWAQAARLVDLRTYTIYPSTVE